ncbi:MAG: ATP-binding cassette domain-containing protein, partial [Roseiflexaceae bacterium]|nr:ATP-binding cassette domain-containing protein [Roseiflexaceae bacterium]
ALRTHIGLVTQEVQLFNASLRENLSLFDPAIADQRLRGALDAVGLGGWLAELPNGLDSVLPPGGGLSAGQAQLLAVARVLLRDPALVILDEASSRLDPATEQQLELAFGRLLGGRTSIIIAHRLATVERADYIMILEDGACLEFGRRSALAADKHSRFAQLLRVGMEAALV